MKWTNGRTPETGVGADHESLAAGRSVPSEAGQSELALVPGAYSHEALAREEAPVCEQGYQPIPSVWDGEDHDLLEWNRGGKLGAIENRAPLIQDIILIFRNNFFQLSL